jgi:metal-responsive CopG/Arc/MetJ family transcriptional regulator
MQRGAIRRASAVFIGGWVPQAMAAAIDRAVQQQDLDRSKFLRRALEEKINRQQ